MRESRSQRRLCGCFPGLVVCPDAACRIRELRGALERAIVEEDWAPYEEAYSRFKPWMDLHLLKWASPLRVVGRARS